MPVSETFRSFVLDQLARLAPAVRAKAMFGGVGIYARDNFFALIADDRLYLKVDDQTRDEFAAQDWGPFRPFGDDRMTMQYYELPLEVIENVDRLRPWVDKALEAAARGGKPKRKAAKAAKVQRTKAKARVSRNKKPAHKRVAKKKGNRGSRG